MSRRTTPWFVLGVALPLASVAAARADDRPAAGNPAGTCAIPAEAQLVDTRTPDHVVGNGSARSCTADAFIDAVALGGVITFDCGPEPVVITLDRPAKVFNDGSSPSAAGTRLASCT